MGTVSGTSGPVGAERSGRSTQARTHHIGAVDREIGRALSFSYPGGSVVQVPRWAFTALLALLLTLLPLGPSLADPGNGKGREDPPAHGRDKDDEESETAEEEAPSEDESTGSGSRPEEPPRPRPTRGPGSSSPRATYADDRTGAVDASFSASPASIGVGETSTISISVTNPSSAPVADVEVLVQLPADLEVVSSVPASTGPGVLRLSLGGIAAGGTVSATVVVVGVDADGSAQPIRFALNVDGETFHHELLVEVGDPQSDGLGLVQSSPLLLQVGDSGSFSATVSNNTFAPLLDVAVVTEVAPELDVVGVTPIVEADAIQLGSSPGSEDIVWHFDSLAPGQEVAMTWTARAAAPGDLEAGNVMAATVAGEPAASSIQATYLGYVRGVRTERSATPAPVVRERVITKMVPVSTEVVAGVGGGLLPVTGGSPAAIGFGGALLIALGSLLLWASKNRRSRRLALVLVGALLLTMTACVSDQGSSDSSREVDAAASPAPDESADGSEEEEEDEVLGLRIERPESDRPADDAGSEPEVTSEEVVEPVTQVVYEEVSEVVSVVVPVAELPVEPLRSRAGDNTFSFTWDPVAGELQGTSSRMLTAEATEELLVGISAAGDRMTATVMVANLADDRRLHIDGSLALEITAADGRTSSLVSEPLDVVLDPGADTTADIAFSLPSGSYTAKGVFQAE